MNLSDTTFIIPARVDSQDRLRNINLICKFLLSNFDCKIIVKESDSTQKINIADIEHPRLIYVYEKTNDVFFHKTKLLNDMIVMCDTEVIVQYDADILLPLSSYVEASHMVKNGYDAVYPFIHGNYSSKKVDLDVDSEKKFYENFDFNVLDSCSQPWEPNNNYGFAHFGFCTFYNSKSYFNGFLENEEFYSGGPEDQEIHHRFVKLGLNVGRVNNLVYHIEHQRGNFSAENNDVYMNNIDLYNRIMNMSKEELINYYSNAPYFLKRKKKFSD